MRAAPPPALPFVSVVVPMFNEEDTIGACLESVLHQDYPPERMEILVIDGGSTDRSSALVDSLARRHSRLRRVHNPKRRTATSLNLALQEAQGEFYLRMDGHSRMEPGYVRSCVEALQRTGADNVGGCIRAVGVTPQGEAIAAALGSRFGVGSARFRVAEREHNVDTVFAGCYRVGTLRSLGGYDESMACNEDDELNLRLTRQGGRIVLSPTIQSTYQCRSTFTALWAQYFRYGKWKVRVMQKHRCVPSPRQLIPGTFVAALLLGLILWTITPWGGMVLAALMGSYAVAAVVPSLAAAGSAGWRRLHLIPCGFLILHVAYGTGFLAGVVSFALGRRRPLTS